MEQVYRLVHTKQCGLDVWLITKDGRTLHSFLSEQYARVRFERIKQTIERETTWVPEAQSR